MAAMLSATSAYAFDVTAPATAPVQSSDNSGANNISGAGSVIITGDPPNGFAVDIDHTGSEDTTIDGTIRILDESEDGTEHDTSDAIGIRIGDGAAVEGDLTLGRNAVIELIDTTSPRRTDEDNGLPYDAYSADAGRKGIFLNQDMTGDLTTESGSRISITSHGSLASKAYGIGLDAELDGNLNLEGSIFLRGKADARGDVVGVAITSSGSIANGYYRQAGIVDVRGEQAVGILIQGAIAESFQLEGSVFATGLASDTVSDIPDSITLKPTQLERAGGAVRISASIGEGILINGAVNRVITADEIAADGSSLPTQHDARRRTGSIRLLGRTFNNEYGALEITGGTHGGVVERFTDSPTTFNYAHSLINRGTIVSDGFNKNAEVVGLRVSGGTLSGGLLNTGLITASAHDADATGLYAFGGAIRQSLVNEGTISAAVTTTDAAVRSARAVRGGSAGLPENSSGDNQFFNRGTVQATAAHTGDGESNARAIAFDFSSRSNVMILTQELPAEDAATGNPAVYGGSGDTDLDANGDGEITEADFPSLPRIVGDVLFGGGDDILNITVGSAVGAVDFGTGANTFNLSGRAVFSGTLNPLGSGSMAINVSDDAVFDLRGQESVSGTLDTRAALTLTDNADLSLTIADFADYTPNTPLINTNTLTLTGDAITITPRLAQLRTEATTIRLIKNAVAIAPPTGGLDAWLGDGNPYIYNVALALADSDTAIDASFRLKTAAELGLTRTQAHSYETVLNYFATDDALGAVLTGFTTRDGFLAAYEELLPLYDDRLTRALANLADATNGATGQRMRLVRAEGRQDENGWAQQFIESLSKSGDAGITGDSYNLAFGYDMVLDGLDIIGVSTGLGWVQVDGRGASNDAIDGEYFSLGLYASDTIGAAVWEGTAQAIVGDFDSSRTVFFGALPDALEADWGGTIFSASGKLIRPLFDMGSHAFDVEIGADYLAADYEGYREKSSFNRGLAMRVGDGESRLATATIGIRGTAQIAAKDEAYGITWNPHYELAYRSVLKHDPYKARARFVDDASGRRFTLRNYEEIDDQIIIGFGLSGHNDYFAIEAGYRGTFGDDDTDTHGGGVTVRLNF